MVVSVRFLGGPMDGLAQGWSIEDQLPERIRISSELAHSRGGIRMEITTPSASGVLNTGELAIDEVSYIQRKPGSYFYEPIEIDFEPTDPHLAPA